METDRPIGAKVNVLLLAYAAFIVLGMPTGLLGVAWPTLRDNFTLLQDAMGLLLITSTLGYLTASMIVARLINRFGIGPLLVFSSLLSAVAFAGYAAMPSWALIVALGLVSGFSTGITDAGLNTYLAAEYKESQMQWLHACFGIGATLSPLIMTASLSLFSSWRPGYVFVGACMALLGAVVWMTLPAWKRSTAPAAAASAGDMGMMDYRTSMWQTLLRPMAWLSVLLFVLYVGAELTLGNWTYTLLTESRGVSPQLAGIWAGGFWATFTFGRILGGLYAHRMRLNALLFGAMVLALVGAVMFWWNPLVMVGVAGVFITGFAMAPIFPGLISTTSQRVGPKHAANTIGMQMAATGLGGAVLPVLGGLLAQRFTLESIPVMLAISLVGLLALFYISVPKKAKQQP